MSDESNCSPVQQRKRPNDTNAYDEQERRGFVIGAGSGIRTHEGVTPNGFVVIWPNVLDLEAVALTTQPSRRAKVATG